MKKSLLLLAICGLLCSCSSSSTDNEDEDFGVVRSVTVADLTAGTASWEGYADLYFKGDKLYYTVPKTGGGFRKSTYKLNGDTITITDDDYIGFSQKALIEIRSYKDTSKDILFIKKIDGVNYSSSFRDKENTYKRSGQPFDIPF